ncbi:serine/threonine protein kinase [bacterium]|nr:serine/threonine protein kinase [bacterium]
MDYPDLPGYEITGLVGKGAMGCVYRGRHREDGQDVAIKTLLVDDPSLQRALANEWEVLSRVEHPYLINEREIIQFQDRAYLVMEYVESQTLTRWIESASPRQRMEEGAEILHKLCEVLAYLHAQNPPVIVRDLKPDNILVLKDNTIKLIDFGIARALEGGAKTEAALKGFASANYAPLEQYSSNATTGVPSDVYSLGATTFHLISGQQPMAAIDFLQTGKDPEKMLLAMGIDQEWAELVGAAMRSKPTQRVSLPTFRVRIPKPKTESDASAPPPPPLPLKSPVQPPANHNSGLVWWLLLALALLLAAIFMPLK